jgi:hypothetical protein
MNFYVPLGNSPAHGRMRPYKIGSHAHVEEAWSMYHGSAPLLLTRLRLALQTLAEN